MSRDRLDHLVRQTRTQTPLVGAWLRKRAAWRIWSRGTPDAVARLARVAIETSDPSLRSHVVTLLEQVEGQHRIDAICQVWVESRDEMLAALMERRLWLASEPMECRVLGALRIGLADSMLNAPPASVPVLLAATRDSDPRIVDAAKTVLRSLVRSDAQSAVCEAFLEQNDPVANEVAEAGGYLPENPVRRALFAFLNSRWQQYESLDFDGAYLRSAYETASSDLRRRLAEVARRAGRMEYVAAASREGRRVGEMTDVEWESAVAVLVGARRFDELWRLAQSARPRWAAQILLRLSAEDWQPPDDSSTFGTLSFEQLVELARSWSDPDRHFADLPSEASAAASTTGSTQRLVIAVSPDNGVVVSSGIDSAVSIWTTQSASAAGGRAMIRQLGFRGEHLAVSPDSRVLAVGGPNGIVMLLGLPEGRQIARLVAHVGAVRGLTTVSTADGVRLVSAGEDGRVRLFSLPVGTELRTLGTSSTPLTSVATTPGREWIATGDASGIVRLMELSRAGDGAVWAVDATESVDDARFVDGARTLAATAGDRLLLVRCPIGRPVHRVAGRVGRSLHLASVEGMRAVCVGGDSGRIAFIRAEDGVVLRHLDGHATAVTALAASSDGFLLLSGSEDGGIKLWALPDGELLHTFRPTQPRGPVTTLSITPDGRSAFVGFGVGSTFEAISLSDWRIARVPLSAMTLIDLRELQAADDRRSQFVAALLARRFQYDVIVGSAPPTPIAVGDFDIQLD